MRGSMAVDGAASRRRGVESGVKEPFRRDTIPRKPVWRPAANDDPVVDAGGPRGNPEKQVLVFPFVHGMTAQTTVCVLGGVPPNL
jgi:hypothetical protein